MSKTKLNIKGNTITNMAFRGAILGLIIGIFAYGIILATVLTFSGSTCINPDGTQVHCNLGFGTYYLLSYNLLVGSNPFAVYFLIVLMILGAYLGFMYIPL